MLAISSVPYRHLCHARDRYVRIKANIRTAGYAFWVAAITRTRYAKAGDVDIAYQVLGDGPIDVLLYTGAIIPIECMDEEPSMARFQHRLASFSRLLRFDRRGIGLSDRGSASAPPTMEQWADDGVAVMDAVGSEQAVVLAPFETAHAGLMLAIAYPERVTGLVIMNGGARAAWAPDYPCGIPETEIDTAVALGAETDAVEKGHDVLSLFAPSVAEDNAFRTWWDRAGNLGATPSMATAMNAMEWESDVRHLLPLVKVPTLITHCDSNPLFDGGSGRYLAEHIPGAKFVELPGTDMLYWVGDTGPLLDEIEEFATGVRRRVRFGASPEHRVVHRHRRVHRPRRADSETDAGGTFSTATIRACAPRSRASGVARSRPSETVLWSRSTALVEPSNAP